VNQKRMFKVIAPMEQRDGGGTYWLRCGTGFVNKDNSINVYLDALPLKVKPGESVKLQLREYTDEDFRERDEKRAAYSARGALATPFTAPAHTANASGDSLPF
jgi:protein associated with RNAse G/E